eukprot:CAMPEP_0197631526 /NCGR_PEP_ID=MMETSP1338-20131121/8664_1 /TAXON_ID=43686 ORGANISM="Pelagodinium beii, Strain RCC1491" /NCGR_SAMPLE_ID=MMETSP1338 /ASSEMBLY_ACC=CAM_ASM_000754 /LENGTH=61 /DNA_ID=CAMNT_0043202999 /DNA_START=185 /DNA_END=370 /DNA_ORIENTATION=-
MVAVTALLQPSEKKLDETQNRAVPLLSYLNHGNFGTGEASSKEESKDDLVRAEEETEDNGL